MQEATHPTQMGLPSGSSKEIDMLYPINMLEVDLDHQGMIVVKFPLK